MHSLTLHARVGRDGILKLETPIGMTDTELEVTLIVHAVNEPRPITEWPPNFFAEILDRWEGTPLIREPQGTYETRSNFK